MRGRLRIRRPGAPQGNLNAAKDRQFSKLMREAQKAARDQRDGRRAEREVRGILDAAGLSDNALAKRIGRRLVDNDALIRRCRDHCSKRGYLASDGATSPALDLLVKLERDDRGELVRLLDRLARVAGTRGGPASVGYVVTI